MQIVKIVLCVAMLLAQLLYYIGPKRASIIWSIVDYPADTFVGFDSFITLLVFIGTSCKNQKKKYRYSHVDRRDYDKQ